MSEQQNPDVSSRFVLAVPTKATLLVTVGLILLGLVFLYVETYNMVPSFLPGYPGDAFYPRVVLVFCMIWVGIILARGVLLPQEAAAVGQEAPYVSAHWLEFVSVFVLVLLYAELLEPLGFEIVTVAMMMILLIPRLLAGPGVKPAQAVLHAAALSATAMLILYLGLGAALKIALPLRFLPIFLY
jgi:hypothetical protein